MAGSLERRGAPEAVRKLADTCMSALEAHMTSEQFNRVRCHVLEDVMMGNVLTSRELQETLLVTLASSNEDRESMQSLRHIVEATIPIMGPRSLEATNGTAVQRETRTERVGENTIQLESRIFVPPTAESVESLRMVVFLPGWSASDAPTLDMLTQQLADAHDATSYLIQTRPEHMHDQVLQDEAQAILHYMQEKNISEVTLVGHSRGGAKAAYLENLIQTQAPQIQVRGLVLLDPIGLYPQAKGDLVSAFAKEALVSTPLEVASNALVRPKFSPVRLVRKTLHNPKLFMQSFQASSDVVFNFCADLWRYKLAFPARFNADVTNLARTHVTQYAAVRCPVTLISGADDAIISTEKIVAESAHRSGLQGEVARGVLPATLAERDELLKVLFPIAPQRMFLNAKRHGQHLLPHYRSGAIASISAYFERRYARNLRLAESDERPLDLAA